MLHVKEMRYTSMVFLIILVNFFYARAQDPIGTPEVTSISNLEYHAGTQNWDIVQDKTGILYFANNEGLLTYNGNYWKLYQMPNKTVVRSICVQPSGKIYVGAQDEIGYFLPNENGVLTYHSLKKLIPLKEQQFADVWNIVAFGDEIHFRTVNKIFRLKGNSIDVYHTPTTFVYMGSASHRLFAQEINVGLKEYSDGNWMIKCKDPRILNENIASIVPYKGDTLMIATLNKGIFLLIGEKLIRKKTELDATFVNDRINAVIKINEDLYAVGTSSAALLIINKQGKLDRQFSYREGITSDNIRNVFLDQRQNLWIGLDDGISFIAFNSAIKNIYPDRNKQIASYASKIFGDRLYIGTSNGVFAANVNLLQRDLSNSKSSFTEVENSKGQAWGLAEINNKLFLANEYSTEVVAGLQAKQINAGLGTWLFEKLNKNNDIVVGTYAGLQLLENTNGNYVARSDFAQLNEPLRFIAVDDKLNCVWAAHPYRGIFKFELSADKRSVVKTSLLTMHDGLPYTLYNYIFKVKGRVVAATANGIYEYNDKSKRFYQSKFFQPIFKNLAIQFLKEDSDGNIWFVSDKKVSVVDFKKRSAVKDFTIVEFPELRTKIVAGFENIYPFNKNNIFIGSNKGLIHIDYQKYAASIFQPNVLLGQIRIIGTKDSVIFGGYAIGSLKKITLANRYNSLHFEFASTLFEQKENIEFSYQLKGFDQSWSIWHGKSEKDYTNLPPGSYTFAVKARNNLGNESEPMTYVFTISPPWYRSNLAYVIYAFAFGFLINLLIKYKEKQHLEQQNKLREEHQLALERNEQQITKLQKKQLEADVEFKNKELAGATMHLVQRGKLLSKIGDELLPLVDKTSSETASDIKKVIRQLNEAKKLDNDWEQFATHFDHVHTNFLSNLKEKYPSLSPADLKLCAYLKLNLSSKEIAQLLNITPRAVEVSRYRLRKKLGLTPDINLFDFLFK